MTATPFVPSGNVSQLRESATIAVSQQARALRAQGRRIIDLGAGEPDFETPEFIRRAAQQAIDDGATRYTAVEGILPLREAIASQASDLVASGQRVQSSEVVVTTGSKQALFNTCFALFGEGDEVLIPTPAWTSYYEMVELARAKAVEVRGPAADGFKVSVDDLERAATGQTRGLILNSPCNPTGAVYTRTELEPIVQLATARGWWLVSDEIYRRIAYAGEAASVLSCAGSRDQMVVIDGMAKSFAMTGWRIGWATAPVHVARTLTALQSHTTSNATTIAQYAALAALQCRDEAQAAVAGMVGEYRRRRDAGVEILASVTGLQFVRPEGAFYFFIDVSQTARGVEEAGSHFAARLLNESGVAVVPGAAFRAPGWIRVSYAAAQEAVVEGMHRIATLWTSLRKR